MEHSDRESEGRVSVMTTTARPYGLVLAILDPYSGRTMEVQLPRDQEHDLFSGLAERNAIRCAINGILLEYHQCGADLEVLRNTAIQAAREWEPPTFPYPKPQEGA